MKRGTFKKQSLEEVKAKQAIKREKDIKSHKDIFLSVFQTKPYDALGAFGKRKASLSRGKGLLTGKVAKQKKSPKKNSLPSISKLKKELDRVFSIFIRQRDEGQCFTCPNKNDYKKMQNGHFVPRQYLAVRWDEKNCHCQCYACNMLYGGQGATYAVRLTQKYGPELVPFLESQRWVTVKLDRAWYEEKIKHYTSILNGV